MSGRTLIGSALLIGKPKSITCRINLISQTDIFQMEILPMVLHWVRRFCMEKILIPTIALIWLSFYFQVVGPLHQME